MADDIRNPQEPQPPKIDLNGNGKPANGKVPPPPRVRPPQPKDMRRETARIDLAAAQMPPKGPRTDDEIKKATDRLVPAPGMSEMSEEERLEIAKKSTVRIDTSKLQPSTLKPITAEDRAESSKKSTVRIDPSATALKPITEEDKAESTKKSTVRIEPSALEPAPGMKPMGARDRTESTKKSTVRIDSTPMETAPGMRPLSDAEREAIAKKSTVRIDTALTQDMRPMSEAERLEAAKKSTVRVQIDEEKAKGDTAKLDSAVVLDAQEAKKKTSRIDLNEVLEGEEDIFKRRTALLDASKFAGVTEAPGVPRTIRIKRPDQPPTGVIKTPVAPPQDAPLAPTGSQAEAKKSETARIDLPPEAVEQPPTRRKTIRIKRPEGTVTSKPLVIARAESAAMAPVRGEIESGEEASPIFSWVAVAAIVVCAILIYVLCSQVGTIAALSASRFPFPGRL